jgi:hypothetical protein
VIQNQSEQDSLLNHMDKIVISKLCNIEKGLEKIDKVAQIMDTILLGRGMNRKVDTEIEKSGHATSPLEKDGKSVVRDEKMDQILDSNKEIEKRLASLEQNIKAIAENLNVNQAEVPHTTKDQHVESGDVIQPLKSGNLNLGKEDWKRLKERLKEAMGYQHDALTEQLTPKTNTFMDNLFGTWMPKYTVDWKEYIFGICTPDGRLGKEGSRSWLACFRLACCLARSLLFKSAC